MKQLMREIKGYYEKVKEDTFGQDQWTSQGRKISSSMTSFERLKKSLVKGFDYMNQNSIDAGNTRSLLESVLNSSKETEYQIQAIKEKTQYFETKFEMSPAEENSMPQVEEVIMDLLNNKEVLEKRRKELENIHQTTAILKETTDYMADQVHKQKEVLNSIEANVETAQKNAEAAKKEITKANELSKGNNKKLYCFIGIVLVVVVVISCIMLAVFLPK